MIFICDTGRYSELQNFNAAAIHPRSEFHLGYRTLETSDDSQNNNT